MQDENWVAKLNIRYDKSEFRILIAVKAYFMYIVSREIYAVGEKAQLSIFRLI